MVTYMAYTDFILKPVILDMSRGKEPITARMIADKTSIPHGTVKNSIKRMLENGTIKRVGGKGRKHGHVYSDCN